MPEKNQTPTGLPEEYRLDNHVFNAKEAKIKKDPKFNYEEKYWYDKFVYWALGGMLVSTLFGIIGFFVSTQFYYLIPLFPVAGSLAWFIRRLFISRKVGDIHKKEII